MGKDFRVGLITGVVLAGAALIWVATRPSLGPRAKVSAEVPSPAASEQSPQQPLPWQELPAPEDVISRMQATAQPAETAPTTPPTTSDPGPTVVSEISNLRSQISEPAPAEPAPRPNLPDLTIYEQAEPIKTTRFHIVQKGDTLSGISQLYYGSPNRWRKILAANTAIKDPNKIAPGTKLTIPD